MFVAKIEPLDPQEAAKLLHKLSVSNPNTRFSDLRTLEAHPIFDDFRFTPKQIQRVKFLLDNGQTLDEIHEAHITERSLQTKSKGLQIMKKSLYH